MLLQKYHSLVIQQPSNINKHNHLESTTVQRVHVEALWVIAVSLHRESKLLFGPCKKMLYWQNQEH